MLFATFCSRFDIASPVSVSSTSPPEWASTIPSSPQPAPTSRQRTAGPDPRACAFHRVHQGSLPLSSCSSIHCASRYAVSHTQPPVVVLEGSCWTDTLLPAAVAKVTARAFANSKSRVDMSSSPVALITSWNEREDDVQDAMVGADRVASTA